MAMHEFVCDVCKDEIVHINANDYGGTGYGVDSDGNKVCYACAGKRDLADMVATGRATLYLSKKEGRQVVSNWPGTLTLPVKSSRTGRHNWAGTREDVWFTDPCGREWHGVCIGCNTQLCHCRRLKAA